MYPGRSANFSDQYEQLSKFYPQLNYIKPSITHLRASNIKYTEKRWNKIDRNSLKV